MHWYTLTPFHQWTAQNIKLSKAGRYCSAGTSLPLNGHTIVAALRNLLPNAIITLRGPFLCQNQALYFPSPLHLRTAQVLVPLTWLFAQTTETCADQLMLWDKRKPAPLVAIEQIQRGANSELQSEKLDCFAACQKDNSPFLPYQTILRLMRHSLEESLNLLKNERRDKLGEQPWTLETQWHNPTEERLNGRQHQTSIEQTIRLKPGWKLAIALDDATDRKLKQVGESLLIHFGETQQFWLESQDEPFRQQWKTLQEQSEQNRKRAEQCLAQQPQAARILAYLVTPGVFERKQTGIATCRNSPWEWNLTSPADPNQPRGPLVSFATTHPIPIHCCCLSNAPEKDISAVQVFAVPAGSVYYLEYPAALFQNQPFLENGKPNKIHIWRQLGYSEFLWISYKDWLCCKE